MFFNYNQSDFDLNCIKGALQVSVQIQQSAVSLLLLHLVIDTVVHGNESVTRMKLFVQETNN